MRVFTDPEKAFQKLYKEAALKLIKLSNHFMINSNLTFILPCPNGWGSSISSQKRKKLSLNFTNH